jgi:hypothetical protein
MCDDDQKSAYHEAGHVIFAKLIGISISYVTIKDHPETKETIWGLLRLTFSKYLKVNREMSIAYYLSGGKVQEYFCKDGEKHPCDEKEIASYGNNPKIKSDAERYVDVKLTDPKIRAQIQKVASVLLDQKRHCGSELLDIMDNR